MTLTLLISGLITSALLTYLMRVYSLKFNVMDIPGRRSSHSIPTPRGGGLAILVTLLALLMYAGLTDVMLWREACALALPASAVAAIGFVDDHRPLSSVHRLIIHIAAAWLAVALLPNLPNIPLGGVTISSPIVIYPIMVIGLVWLLNLYNFMDGIDGIAGSEAISVLLAAATILYMTNDNYWSPILIWSCAPIAGFLIWNWQPAKIFMGDAGSGFLGITIGIMALLTSAETQLTLWSWLILLAVFIADATWTLLVRMATGQAWHKPHRSHTYQILARNKKSHAFVSFSVVIINLGWLAPLAWLATIYPDYGWTLTIFAYLPLLGICWAYSAGQSVEKITLATD